ncbi:MAG TPA: hypothetical protein VF519_03540 [Mycobacteriales bacterium]|jgi:hypothetical protein
MIITLASIGGVVVTATGYAVRRYRKRAAAARARPATAGPDVRAAVETIWLGIVAFLGRTFVRRAADEEIAALHRKKIMKRYLDDAAAPAESTNDPEPGLPVGADR